MQAVQHQTTRTRPYRGAPRLGGSTALPMLAVGALTLVGVVVRLIVANQALFADELATYWVITSYGLSDVVSVVHTNAEITPPLYFVLAWFWAQLGYAEELIRAPSLIAGTATIPLVYILGARTVGRPAALVGATLATFSPFMIYYSAEARAYAVMMLLVVVSTLAMLRAVETRRVRWWVLYALSSCLAMYSHYTCVFLLATQLAWLLWTHPDAWRPAVLANLGALVTFLPWVSGVKKDFSSPTTDITSALTPFSLDYMRIYLEHWAFAFPYPYISLSKSPGALALVLLGAGSLLALAGLVGRFGQRRRRGSSLSLAGADRHLLLIVALAVSVPLCTAVASAVGNNIIGVRNLAASWPAFGLSLGALLVAAGPRLRYPAAGLVITAFVIAGLKMLDNSHGRPDHKATAAFIASELEPGDAVIDGTAVISPGPLSMLDITLRPTVPTFRAGAPAEKDHPFGFSDPIVPVGQAFRRAASVGAKRIFFVSTQAPATPGYELRERALRGKGASGAGYTHVATHKFAGFLPAKVEIFESRSPAG